MLDLGDHYRAVDGRQRSDWERLQRQFSRKRDDQERREKLGDRLDDNIMALALEVVTATEAQLRQFEAKLTTYEAATVVALMENQERLDAVQAQMFLLLDQAYVTEDGRRVFRTEDGTQVFDEFGTEVGRDEIDPSLIGDEFPTWESYAPLLAENNRLTAEREQLLDYQDRLDEAREEIDGGEISEADLKELDAELAELMPPTVRQHVPGMAMPEPAPQLLQSFAKSAVEPSMLMREEITPTPSL
ncbi:MAG: hypothetical protein ACRBBQ_02030 [Cognatishimia sp.]